ncbi:hypothetical protein CROQUDRAFT_54243, partial [Cronartium quercuum f. sp. fusiforme G11]
MTIDYNPYKLWDFLKTRHFSLTEGKLRIVDKALHDYKQSASDSLSSHVDKFEKLIQEFFSYGGEMSDVQSARLLMSATPDVDSNDTLTAVIYAVVVPFTRQGLSNYLKQMESNSTWTSPVIQEVNACTANSKCTPTHCMGLHKYRDCFARPGNEKQKAEWIAK